jgi:hypothetical protein
MIDNYSYSFKNQKFLVEKEKEFEEKLAKTKEICKSIEMSWPLMTDVEQHNFVLEVLQIPDYYNKKSKKVLLNEKQNPDEMEIDIDFY